MSQCPLGFKGTPPPAHPKIARVQNTSPGTSEPPGWNPWLLLALDALFILAAIYIATNGLPTSISDLLKSALRTNQPKPDAKEKTE